MSLFKHNKTVFVPSTKRIVSSSAYSLSSSYPKVCHVGNNVSSSEMRRGDAEKDLFDELLHQSRHACRAMGWLHWEREIGSRIGWWWVDRLRPGHGVSRLGTNTKELYIYIYMYIAKKKDTEYPKTWNRKEASDGNWISEPCTVRLPILSITSLSMQPPRASSSVAICLSSARRDKTNLYYKS